MIGPGGVMAERPEVMKIYAVWNRFNDVSPRVVFVRAEATKDVGWADEKDRGFTNGDIEEVPVFNNPDSYAQYSAAREAFQRAMSFSSAQRALINLTVDDMKIAKRKLRHLGIEGNKIPEIGGAELIYPVISEDHENPHFPKCKVLAAFTRRADAEQARAEFLQQQEIERERYRRRDFGLHYAATQPYAVKKNVAEAVSFERSPEKDKWLSRVGLLNNFTPAQKLFLGIK